MSIESISGDDMPNRDRSLGFLHALIQQQEQFDAFDNEFDQFTFGEMKVGELSPLLENNPFRMTFKVDKVGVLFDGSEKLHSYKRSDGSSVSVTGIVGKVVQGCIRGTKGFSVVVIETDPIFDDVSPKDLPEYVIFVPIKGLIDYTYLPPEND